MAGIASGEVGAGQLPSAIYNLHLRILSRAQPNILLYTLASKEMALCINADTLAFDVKKRTAISPCRARV